MIIEVKTVEILAKQKMQFEATTVVKEEKLIKFMTGFKNSLKETRNDGYIKEVALHLGVDENNNLITREYAKVILNPLFINSNEKIEEIIQEMKKVEEKIEKETTIKNWQENFKYVLDYMLENKKFIIKTYNSLSRKTLLDFLFKQYNTIFIDIINDVSKNYNITKENKIFIANFYKYGFAGVIENWIVTEMKESPENIIKKLNILISGNFEEAVRKMSN